jgi:hypothetical protein
MTGANMFLVNFLTFGEPQETFSGKSRQKLIIYLRPPLGYGVGPWAWSCSEPSKQVQRLSHGNSKIISL